LSPRRCGLEQVRAEQFGRLGETLVVHQAGQGTARPAAGADPRPLGRTRHLLTYIDGRPTVLPEMLDDVVEVKCWRSDQMTDWKANRQELVGGSWERTDGTGIQVQPEFTGQTETLTITVSCRRG
jgi:hypothetical protein